jgi:hypothetical protein
MKDKWCGGFYGQANISDGVRSLLVVFSLLILRSFITIGLGIVCLCFSFRVAMNCNTMDRSAYTK